MKQLININLLPLAILTIFASSCSYLQPYKVPVMQGNIIEDKDISKLEKGMTKGQVDFIFGRAVIMDPFHNNRWDYFNSITVGEEIITERKLSIFFNDDGVVDSWVLEKLSDN